jgi:hypothetical protein
MQVNQMYAPFSHAERRRLGWANVQTGRQGQKTAEILAGFDFEGCDAWKALKSTFRASLRHRELQSLGEVLVREFALPPLNRDTQRSMAVMIKWFQDNWSAIEPILPAVQMLDEESGPPSEATAKITSPQVTWDHRLDAGTFQSGSETR